MKNYLFKKHRFVSLLLTLTMILSLSVPVLATDEPPNWYEGDWPYVSQNGDTLDSFTVDATGNLTEYSGAGGHVVIPEGVTAIDKTGANWTFYYYPGWHDFQLTQVDLPSTLVDIGASAFYGQTTLENLILPINLETIGEQAFADTGITGEIVLPPSLVSIGASAFHNTNISGDLVIPENITSIGSLAFAFTLIENVVLEGDESSAPLSLLGALVRGENLSSVIGDRKINWSQMGFGISPKLETINMPNWSGTISASFAGHSSLVTEMAIPEGVTEIYGHAMGAFSGTNIKEIGFPVSMTAFGGAAILGGESADALAMPDSQLQYAAILSENAAISNPHVFKQRPVNSGGEYPGKELFKAVYVYPNTTTEANALSNTNLGADKVRYLTRTIQVTVQNSSAVGYSFDNEITAAWNDCTTDENIFPSFEPTVLDAWANVKASDSSLPDFDALTLNGVRYTNVQAGSTAILEDDVLHFIPTGMTSAWFMQGSTEKQAVDIAPSVDAELILTSIGGPVANMPLYKVASDGSMSPLGIETDAQGKFILNLTEGDYVITPYDTSANVAFSFLAVSVAREAKLGGLVADDATPSFSSVNILGTDFAAGTLTKVDEVNAIAFDSNHTEYDFYANKNTSSVKFTVSPQVAETASDMRLTVSGTSVSDASPSGGTWTVDVPLSESVTPVTFEVKDTTTNKTTTYTINIKRVVTWDGVATALEVSDPADMAMLSVAVDNGKSFSGVTITLTDDITLPIDWVPLGGGDVSTNVTQMSSSVRPFSGTFDGDNHTITFEEGARPLLRFARNATVQNLTICGTDINGHGLLEYYFVDYGPTGSYAVWEKSGIGTLDVKNFTIKASTNIRGSGITGGYASGVNTVNVIDSTVEAGVKIGYNVNTSAPNGSTFEFASQSIGTGSFGGDFNGTVTNSVSSASVYGSNYVGGLIGAKGQSMGLCEVVNSQFHGSVTATGNYVGGLVGGGYVMGDAPNTPAVSIENSYVTGTISGGNYVGGIFGGEPGLKQCWDNGIGYIRNNHFVGTITSAGQYVGGIIGYMDTLNRYNIISNNYYLENSGVEKGIGGIRLVDTNHSSPANGANYANSSVFGHGLGKDNHNRTDDPLGTNADDLTKSVNAVYMSGTEIVTALNTGEGSWKNWEQGTHPVHDVNAAVITSKLIVEGDFKTIYYTSESFDTTGMTITAQKTDGTTQTLNTDAVTFEGFDSSKTGAQVITAKYDGVQALFTVSVIANYGTGNTGGSGGTSNTMQVTFILIGSSPSTGDIDLGSSDGYKGARYEQWIAPITYTMDEGATVLELFVRALGAKGMSYSLVGGDNYIETINGLSEFTNGPRSGWMYTVGTDMKGLDGTHPNLGLREYVLTGGEVVIWHYVNDYAHEVEDWFADAAYPALGDGTYFNKWREAIGGTSGGTSNNNITTGGNTTVVPDASEIITVPSTTTNGSATATVPTDAVKDKVDAVLAAAKNSSDLLEIVIDVNTSVNTTALNTQLEKEAIQAIADTNNIQLTITSALGDMTFDNATIKGLLSSATAANAKIVISIAQADKTGLNADTLESLSDNKAFKLTITIDGKPVENFRGTATVFLPYELGNQNAKDLTVYHVNDKGEATAMTNVWYITKDGVGGFEFTTTHFSLFMVALIAETETNDWINPFTDVKEGDWYYEAVRYVSENSLMVGGGDGKFNPNAQLTRAMLVQVLYNNEGRPAVTAANPFTDAANGMWYTDAIIWASDSGIIAGYGSGLFGPNDNITREQVVVILNNYAKWLDLDVSATTDLARYTDSSEISSWARSAMQWANATELMLGRSATTLVPQGETTRAEIATLLMKFIENIIK